MWLSVNWWWPGSISSMNVRGEGKVCWICRIREVQPDWRPGMPIPKIPNAQKFKAAPKEE
jgi:hypothetical protein